MCLAVAGTIVSVEGEEAVLDFGGTRRRAELTLVPQAKIGDRVLVHAGFAIAVLDERAGDELLHLTAEMKRYG